LSAAQRLRNRVEIRFRPEGYLPSAFSEARLVSQREANPGYDRIPLALFRGGIIDQHAVHVSIRPVAAVVPDPVVANAGHGEEAWGYPFVLDASRRSRLGEKSSR